MDKFFHELTHNNDLFEKQWPQLSDRLRQLFDDSSSNGNRNQIDIIAFKVNVLNALVAYVLAEPVASDQPVRRKFTLVDEIAKRCASDPLPSFPDLVHIFQRLLDAADIFDMWHLACIEAFYCEFRLGECLSSGPSIDLIESIFKSLQKHSFSNDKSNPEVRKKWQEFLSNRMFSTYTTDSNRLNVEPTMFVMQSAFQQLYR